MTTSEWVIVAVAVEVVVSFALACFIAYTTGETEDIALLLLWPIFLPIAIAFLLPMLVIEKFAERGKVRNAYEAMRKREVEEAQQDVERLLDQ